MSFSVIGQTLLKKWSRFVGQERTISKTPYLTSPALFSKSGLKRQKNIFLTTVENKSVRNVK